MKTIKDCKEVHLLHIHRWERPEWWWNIPAKAVGLEGDLYCRSYKTRQGAMNNFKKFAKLNGIENYSIKE